MNPRLSFAEKLMQLSVKAADQTIPVPAESQGARNRAWPLV
jgi:hypothetical protein